jgi:hypothetical protein
MFLLPPSKTSTLSLCSSWLALALALVFPNDLFVEQDRLFTHFVGLIFTILSSHVYT